MAGRACDACRRRKIKCVGAGLACRNCSAAALACTFNTLPLKKGPKGQNASVLQELRQPRKRPPLSHESLSDCIEAYYSKLFLVLPIIDASQFNASVDFDNLTTERFCLITALCALTNLQVLNRPADDLIRETLRARQTFDYVETPTLDSVHISFFLFACFFGLNIHNTAWFYLREAITFAQLIGLDSEENYSRVASRQDAAYRRRSFWVLFVTERAYAIQRHHSLSMQPSIDLPSSVDHDCPENMSGFNYMVDLWSQIDNDFLSMWNDKRFPISADWMSNLHRRVQNALPARLDISEVQEADILVSQQWLRTILWQLGTSRMLLSSSSNDEFLRFSFPIQISHDLLAITNRMSPETLEVHGIGICEKVFEVASTLVDVMICDPSLRDPQVAQKANANLHALLQLLGTLRDGSSTWHAIILEKVRSSLPDFRIAPTPDRVSMQSPGAASSASRSSTSTGRHSRTSSQATYPPPPQQQAGTGLLHGQLPSPAAASTPPAAAAATTITTTTDGALRLQAQPPDLSPNLPLNVGQPWTPLPFEYTTRRGHSPAGQTPLLVPVYHGALSE